VLLLVGLVGQEGYLPVKVLLLDPLKILFCNNGGGKLGAGDRLGTERSKVLHPTRHNLGSLQPRDLYAAWGLAGKMVVKLEMASLVMFLFIFR